VGGWRRLHNEKIHNLHASPNIIKEDLGTNGKIILEWILGKQGGKVWTGCTWLRIGTSGGLL